MKIVNSAEMREIEGQCESKGIPTSQLMENAGSGVCGGGEGVDGRSHGEECAGTCRAWE